MVSPSFSAPEAIQRSPSRKWRLNRRDRVLLAGLGLGLLGLLAIAAVLRPDQKGYGTHRQLGLPPCTFVVIFGQRCPSCGMTTSWAYLVRGRVVEALRANSGGTLLGVLAMITAPWAIGSAARGRWLWGPLSQRTMLTVAMLVIVVTLGDWLWRWVTQ